ARIALGKRWGSFCSSSWTSASRVHSIGDANASPSRCRDAVLRAARNERRAAFIPRRRLLGPVLVCSDVPAFGDLGPPRSCLHLRSVLDFYFSEIERHLLGQLF